MELLNEIWQTARRNKLRTTLTGFAVAWGIFMIIVLLGAGNGLINAAVESNGRFLTNSMRISGGWTDKAYRGMKEGRSITLNSKDLLATQTEFDTNIDDVGAEMSQQAIISMGKEYVSASLDGVYPNHIRINKREMISGRFINEIDIRERRKVVVLSRSQAKELAKTSNLIGKYVNVGNIAFKVVGIYKDDESRQNNEAFTSFTTIQTMYGRGNEMGTIEYSFHGLPTEKDNEAFERRYQQRLNANHDAAPDDEGAIWIWNRFTSAMQMNKGMDIIHTALWVVGLFTLLSGVVGVSNIMLITVKERTHEFGIRKAIGAKPWTILKLIIVESVIITTFFGYIGMVLGVAANEYMDATIGHDQIDTGLFKATMFVDPTVGLDVCIEATLVMIIAGTIAGLIPSLKAARIRPIEALRAE
ncbi:MAG: ABC transporter permease [Prevotella sp.]|nr:ABC transporter permease [Prevotella sp.]